MRLMSFNVNSIKAYLKKDLLDQWSSFSPDVIGFEELKLSETAHDNFPLVMDSMIP